MPDMPITKKDLELLKKIIYSKDPLMVTFQENTEPSFAYDLKGSDCDYIVRQQYAEYFNQVREGYKDFGDLSFPIYIKGNIKATKLGEYVFESYEKDENRYKTAMRISIIALVISGISILISVL